MGFKQVLILGIIFLLPLLGSFKGFGYEQVKVLFFIVSISLIGFLWMGRGFKWSITSKTAGLFILFLIFTSFTGISLEKSLLGYPPYYQGWILYAYLFLFYLMVKTFKIGIKAYALVISGPAFIVSILAVKDWVLLNIFNQPIPAYAGRVVSTFGQPNFYAGFLLLTLPFSYFLWKNPSKKMQYFGWGSSLISFVAIWMSYSRSAILLALFLLLLGLIDQLKIKFKWITIVFGVVFISILLALKFSSGIVGNEISRPIKTNNPDLTKESVEKRVYIWPQAWKIAMDRPLAGYGLENISSAFSNYFTENKYQLFEANLKVSPVLISLKELNIDRTHNYLLDLLLFSGILGVLGWVILVILLLIKIKQTSSDRGTFVVSLILYLIWIQFQNQSIVHLIYFWLFVGLIDKVNIAS